MKSILRKEKKLSHFIFILIRRIFPLAHSFCVSPNQNLYADSAILQFAFLSLHWVFPLRVRKIIFASVITYIVLFFVLAFLLGKLLSIFYSFSWLRMVKVEEKDIYMNVWRYT